MYCFSAFSAISAFQNVIRLAAWIVVGISLTLPAIAAEPKGLPGPTIPKGLGVNIHFTTRRPGELEMLRDGGFRFVRMDFTWSGIERKRGEYDFSAYDKLVAALDKEQIRAIFILDYGNAMYDGGDAPRTDEGREGFARFVVAALTHFQGRGIVWEMWNEPNIFFWRPKPDAAAYAKLALTVGKAIRGTPAIAHELYIGPAVSTIDLKFLETCFQAGCLNYWDAVSVHPYRQDPGGPKSDHVGDPESVLADYARIRELIQKYAPGRTIPIISGEWGYSSGWKAYDPDRQGKMLPRQWLVNLSAGIPISIWYDWHDDGIDAKEPEHHFGTIENAYHAGRTLVYDPKPAYTAAKTLTTTLAGYEFVKAIKSGEDREFILEFRKGQQRAWAAWTTGEPRKTTLAVPAGRYQVVSHLGKTSSATAGDGGLSIELTDAVRYIVAP
jgi:hypothetical protein